MLMMTDQYGTPGSMTLDMAQAAAGAYNSIWLSWLQGQAAAAPNVKVVRIWQEINGNWMAWSQGTPAQIIAAWRNMATQVRIAFPKAVIEWNLNVGTGWSGQPGDGSGFDLYPGDDLVDVIGMDTYEKSTSWADAVNGPGVNLNNLVAFASAHNKLVAISETAANSCDASYITNLTAWLDSLGARAAYLSYYEGGTSNNGDNVLWATTGTDSCPSNTLRAAFLASSFGTKKFGGTWVK
jgi:hypothetical protein